MYNKCWRFKENRIHGVNVTLAWTKSKGTPRKQDFFGTFSWKVKGKKYTVEDFELSPKPFAKNILILFRCQVKWNWPNISFSTNLV